MSEKIKIIDERETHEKTKQNKNKNKKEQGGTEAIVKGWELNDLAVRLG